MDITLEKVDALNAKLKLKLTSEDYHDKVEEVIVNYRKTASIPGFRKGKVPIGQVRKMIGKSVLIDEVNKLLQEAIYKHITENKVEVLGNPLPLTSEVDWDNATEFTFEYEMGLAPQFKVNLDKKDKFDFLKIIADKKMVEHYVNDMAKRYGKMTQPTKSEKTDLMMGEFNQLDVDGNFLDGGINHAASVALDIIKDKKAQKALIGLAEGDEVKLRINKDFSNDAHHMLNIKKEELENLDADFNFKVNKISRMDPAELNQEALSNIITCNTIYPLQTISQAHSAMTEVDFFLARCGYNTLSESIFTNSEPILVSEELNPEIESNLNYAIQKGLKVIRPKEVNIENIVSIINISTAKDSLIKSKQDFSQKDLIKGRKECAEIILSFLV